MTPRWPLTPLLLRSYVCLYPRIILSKSHENMSKYVDKVTFFFKNLNQRSLTPRWPLTPSLWRSHVWLYPRIIVSKSHENTSKYMYVDTVTFFSKTWTKGHWPLDDLWPHICLGHMCDSTQGFCVQVPWEYINVYGYSDQFSNKAVLEPRVSPAFAITYFCNHCNIRFENTSKYVDTLTLFSKNLNQRSLTPGWPLTPCLLRSHVWLYPRIIVSKSHDNTSMYVDTVINFAKYHIHTHTYTYYIHIHTRVIH